MRPAGAHLNGCKSLIRPVVGRILPMARVPWVTAILKEAGWQISGLTIRNHIRLQTGYGPITTREPFMVNMADRSRNGTCAYPGKSAWNVLKDFLLKIKKYI